MTREEMEGLRDYLDSLTMVQGHYEVQLSKTELEALVSALDEVISF